jgi:hypothetical protein
LLVVKYRGTAAVAERAIADKNGRFVSRHAFMHAIRLDSNLRLQALF